jgi:histidinol-phosphate aminotransferase
MTLSRRAFAQLLGAGAAIATMPPLIAANTARNRKHASGVVRLSSNENPYGPSRAALQAMTDAFDLAWRYPDEAVDALIADIAKQHGVGTDSVILGDGSSEILKLAAAAYTGAGRNVVMADPTFEALGAYTAAAGGDVVKVPLDANWRHDVSKMAAVPGAALIYVCNPNNPTASITPKAAVRSLIASVPATTMVLVDEAYFHYVDNNDYETVVPLVATQPNLIVARTFSKIYGMAGLRCGYAVAQPSVIRKLAAQGAWDSVNIMAIAAARASLSDAKHVLTGRQRNRETKANLIATLQKLGYSVIPSEANFVMIDTRREVKPLIAAMRSHAVEVGRLFPAMPHHLRVTIGRPEEMEKFVDAFRTSTT